MYRRARSASAAPGVRALAFSALSGQPAMQPGTNTAVAESHNPAIGTHAQHSQQMGARALATNFLHSGQPQPQDPHVPREVSLREALHLQDHSDSSTLQGHHHWTSESMHAEGRASSASVDLRPHSSSRRRTYANAKSGGGNLALLSSSSPGRAQHARAGDTHRRVRNPTNDCTGFARGRSTSPTRAAHMNHSKYKLGESESDWHSYQQRMLDGKEGTAKLLSSGLEEDHGAGLSTRNVPEVSPGKRRACRSTSPAKKAANSRSHGCTSPKRPTAAVCDASAPWRSPGKGGVLLGRSGLCHHRLIGYFFGLQCRRFRFHLRSAAGTVPRLRSSLIAAPYSVPSRKGQLLTFQNNMKSKNGYCSIVMRIFRVLLGLRIVEQHPVHWPKPHILDHDSYTDCR